jgi:subtilisin family serine protease
MKNFKALIVALLVTLVAANSYAELKGHIVYKPAMPGIQSIKASSVDGLMALGSESKRVESLVSQAGAMRVSSLEVVGGASFKLRSPKLSRLARRLQVRGFAIEPDVKVKAFRTPNDTYFGTHQQDLVAIGAPTAWDVSTGNSSIVVGVIDTGIDATHPDLAANMWRDPVTGAFGRNFVNAAVAPSDDNGHGTHVAGIIGAVGNNAAGVSGATWAVKLMALKTLDARGSGSMSGMIAAVNHAVTLRVQQGVNLRVLNASLGGTGYSVAAQQAVTAAIDAGILFVAAAGNEAVNNGVTPSYPAGFPGVLSVAATDNAGTLASFSNFNATAVHIAAPGVSILSTYPVSLSRGNPPYGQMSGTSMAAPRVAGAAALIVGANPALTQAQLRARLLSTARAVPALSGRVATGLLNIANAVILPATPSPPATASPTASRAPTVVPSPSPTSTPMPTASRAPTTVPTAIPTATPTRVITPTPAPTVSGPRILGTIRLNGAAAAGMTVRSSTGRVAVTDASGAFALTGLVRGTVVGLSFSRADLVIPGQLLVPIIGDVVRVNLDMRTTRTVRARDAGMPSRERVRVRRIKG